MFIIFSWKYGFSCFLNFVYSDQFIVINFIYVLVGILIYCKYVIDIFIM